MANLDYDEKTSAHDTTILTAVFDASIVNGKTSYLNATTGDDAIIFDYPFSDIHDPLQLWDSESVPLCIPDIIANESMSSEEKVMDWLRSTLKAETHTQAQSSLSIPSVDSGLPLKCTMPINTRLPLYTSARVELDGETPIYIPRFIQSKQMSHLKDMLLPSLKSSKVFKSNQQKCLGMQLRRRRFDSSSSHQRGSSVNTTVDKCMSSASSATQIIEHSLIDQSGGNDTSDPFSCSYITCKDRFTLEPHHEDSFNDISSNGSSPKFVRRTMCCATRVGYSRTVEINVMLKRKILKPKEFYPMNY
ncbi:hypothetical protein CHS0354_007616 [Potamilus streckersoni]|uniref:Uncharacterized protein n=1 Tax=Potamilus streckersoni TaxID=2493646 RepID=A0AAE0T4E8_9BIVA|nr:hypothetical protein CHS0354_007616 [Potamilus streckersoni]